MKTRWQIIEAIAKEQGFIACGAIRNNPKERTAPFTPLEFLQTPLHRRKEELLEEAQSVLIFLWPYAKVKAVTDGTAPLSASAQGRDYHLVIAKKLEPILHQLALFGEKTAWQVDNGPLEERPFAVAAGLGYIGKNGQLIHPTAGAFVHIALIATTGEYDAISTFHQTCGACRACINACPTGAITENGVDATRCVSYLTQKKALTQEEFASITTAYGCDVCLDVCPKNKGVPTVQGEGIPFSILCQSNKSLAKAYRDHAAFWRGPTIIKRNLLAILHHTAPEQARALIEDMPMQADVLQNALQWIKESANGQLS